MVFSIVRIFHANFPFFLRTEKVGAAEKILIASLKMDVKYSKSEAGYDKTGVDEKILTLFENGREK